MSQWLPPAHFLAIQLLTGTTVAFTPANSPFRTIASLLTVILAYCMQLSAKTHLQGTRFGAPLVAMCWMNVLNGIDLLVLTRADYEKQLAYNTKQNNQITPKSPQKGDNSLKDKYLWSLNLSFNYRRINTPWQIHALTTFTKGQPPTRARFLTTSLLKLAASIAIIQLFTLETTDPYLGRAVDKLPVRPEEILLPFWYHTAWDRNDLVLRILFTLSFGIVARAFIVAGYTAAAVIAVGFFGQEPRMWPPVAGGLVDGWSVRRFWGKTWHQTLRQLLCSNADFVSGSLLRLPVRFQWCFRVIFAFLVSGLVHMCMDVGFGVRIDESGALWFFALQILGVAGEMLAEKLLAPVSVYMSTRVRRGVGYVWVAAFMVWTLPVWIYPILVQLYADGVRMMSPFLGLRGWDV
ncbi:hypothetical protein AbraIFM66951_000653 [Aspergillus brasiliensis]|uniref:Wax synthase domain-containing protein n=1 Tax=Aspergillus brasiliensis TaxID=319629 RepID=A0A9W5YZN9_9EURO|nr:hypothetical protein AbraCBS73388_001071 [Aspergillus brasiliensis]GKZ48575.1 hypothetical protein AbraIFM66951_000653 [Aspergillus brasiliensis]